MVLKSYLIAPFNSGQVSNVEPWLIPEDAFQFLTNAYVWRGRVRKRFGSYGIGVESTKSRLRINIGTTSGAGNISTTVPGSVFQVGQMFSIGDEIFTVNAAGTPGTLLTTGSATLATYNTTTGALVINGADATTSVFFYPALPVMGLKLRETSNVNFEDTIGFDTQFAYSRSSGAWTRLGSASWSGDNSNFFWSINYRGSNAYETYFYVVNGVAADNIKYLPQGSSTWTNLRPQLNSSGTNRYLETAQIIVGFKDRIVALNTIEDEGGNDRSYINRARWSQNGDPTAPTTSWIDDTAGKGGYVDPPTQESITTCEFIKDRLIVYFERSTWELVYTGDSTLPFRWQQINNELGAESRFSIIGFDRGAVGVGNVGVHTCNGVNVSRIDQKIPDEVFNIHNGNDGPQRVYGVRDYYRELVYWTFPDDTGNPTYPTNVLVWNYQNDSWAMFNDSFTCFGYFQKDSNLTWSQLGEIYGTWAEWGDPWGGAQGQSQFPYIIAGNQEGFVFIIDADKPSNSQSVYITDMTDASSTLTIIDHNLIQGDYILIEDSSGITSLNDVVVQVDSVTDDDNVVIDTTFTGTYSGGGYATRISNFNISSKQWNPGTPVGQQFRMPYIDFLLDRTVNGEVSLDYLIDTTSGQSIQNQTPTGVLLGSNTLYTQPEYNATYQPNQVRIWHRYFLQTTGSFLQIQIFMDDDQMRDVNISQSNFQINAIILYVEPSGRIVG